VSRHHPALPWRIYVASGGACALVQDRVCGAALVRRSLNLSRALQQTDDAETRERLIENTYAAGNLEARFIQGMRVFFRQHDRALHAPLDDLEQAARSGRKPAAYMLAMILLQANSGTEADVQAKQLLAEVVHYDQALAVYSVQACTPTTRSGCTSGPTFISRPPCLAQCLAPTFTSVHPRAGDGSRADAARPPATKDGSNGPTSVARNAGSGASAMTPSAGSGLIIRI